MVLLHVGHQGGFCYKNRSVAALSPLTGGLYKTVNFILLLLHLNVTPVTRVPHSIPI